MYLFLFTIIYCIITWVLNINYELALGVYLISSGFFKGILSENFKEDFLNMQKTTEFYKKVGFKDSLMEFLSIILVFLNSYLIDYEPFTAFEFIWIFFVIAISYRFAFWGITRMLRKKIIEIKV